MKKRIELALFTLILLLTANVAFAQTPTTADGWKGLAIKQTGQKNYADAITSFTNCIGSSPDSSENAQTCFFGRGLLYHRAKNYQQAISDFSKSIEINPRIWKPYDWRGDAHANIRKYEEAIKDYTKAIELNPNSAVLYYKRGSVYFYLGSDQEERDYTKAIQLDPKYVAAYESRAAFYCEDGKDALAKADEQKIISLGGTVKYPCAVNASENAGNTRPANARTVSAADLIRIGITYRNNCEYQKSVDSISQAIEREPDSGDHHLEMARSQIFLSVNTAIRYHQAAQKLWDLEPKPDFNSRTKQERFKKETDHNIKTGARRTGWSELRTRLGVLIKANKTRQEPGCKRQSTDQVPGKATQATVTNSQAVSPQKTADDWVKLGNENFGSKKFKEAIDAYTKCIELAPRANVCYGNRAVAHFNLDNYKQAIADTTKAIEIDPNYDFAYQKRRASYCGSGMIERAEKDERKIISLGKKPEFKECVNLRTLALEKAGDLEMTSKNYSAALKEYDSGLGIHPNSVTYKKRALVHCKIGNKALAKADEAKVIGLGGTIEIPCTATSDQISGTVTQPVTIQPIRNSRQPTQAEIKASEAKGFELTKKLSQMVSGKPVAEANKIYGSEINRLINEEDLYAGFFALLKIPIAANQLIPILEFIDKRNRTAIKTLSKRTVTNYKNGLAKLAEIPYPNDIPLPGRTWNSSVANNSDLRFDPKDLGFPKLPSGISSSNSAANFFERGRTFAKTCHYTNAAAEFTKAIQLDPNNGDYYMHRANSAYIFIDRSKAEADMKKAQELWKLEKKPDADSKISEQMKYDANIQERTSAQTQFSNILRILRTKNQNALEPVCKAN